MSRTCDEIGPGYHHDETCMRTVPEELKAECRKRLQDDMIEVVDHFEQLIGG